MRDVSLSVNPGQLLAVVGPNGAGKTTLLRLLTGSLGPHRGEVLLDERSLNELENRARARAVAVVPQSESSPFAVTVREMVAMGRYAHLGPWERTGAHDRAVVERALERCAVAELADRQLAELSGVSASASASRARLPRKPPHCSSTNPRPALTCATAWSSSTCFGSCAPRDLPCSSSLTTEPRGPFRRPPAAARPRSRNGARSARRRTLARSAGGHVRMAAPARPAPRTRERYRGAADDSPQARRSVKGRRFGARSAASRCRGLCSPSREPVTPCQEQGTRAPP